MRITLPEPEKFSRVFESIVNIPLNNIIYGISTDSRQCMQGDLYIAIKGENVDGHNFIKDAKKNGAVAALVDKSMISPETELQKIDVDCPIQAIGQVAKTWRKQFNISVLGITGSNGKTTTKDLVKHFLESKYNVHATKGNYNTSIGVPLTLLQLQQKHDFSVIEMGANQPGDIKTLSQIVDPTDGLITNIAPAHLEGFGSIENIAKEKAELFNYLKSGTVYKNVSDELIDSITTSTNTVTYGCNSDCDFCADYSLESNGNIILIINANELNINSQSMVFAKNVLAAATAANSFGVEWEGIQERLSTFTPTYGRNVITKYGKISVIDDSYNANYNSTIAAIEHLSTFKSAKRKIFVFGDMAELGEFSKKYHQKIGQKCNENNLDAVFTVGTETEFTNAELNSSIYNRHFYDKSLLGEELQKYIENDDVILFKGSRSMEMETVIQKVFRN